MAELLVFTVSNKLHDRGDVICICSDGHAWSEHEKNRADFAILKMPRINADQLTNLIEGKSVGLRRPLLRHSRLRLEKLSDDPTLKQVMDATEIKAASMPDGIERGVIG